MKILSGYSTKHSQYLEVVFKKKLLRTKMAEAVKILRSVQKCDTKFDSIAVMGVSGLTFGTILAYRLNKHLIVVRKPHEDSHCRYDTELPGNGSKYVIVDDFISTGKTLTTIIKKINDADPTAELIGGYFYKFSDEIAYFKKSIDLKTYI